MSDRYAKLNDTRIQVHWAAQILAAFGKAHVTPRPLWHHVALRFVDGNWSTLATDGARIALELSMARAAIYVRQGTRTVGTVHMAGRTLDGARDRVRHALDALGLDDPLALRDPEDMPSHELLDGAEFSLDKEALTRLDTLYEQAATTLGEQAARRPGAHPALLWPHHFDVSTMQTVEEGTRDDAEDGKTATLGFSPGDTQYDEPYWFVTPWPIPDAPPDTKLAAGGTWHGEGWVGAVLLQNAIDDGQGNVAEFLESAYPFVRMLTGAPAPPA